MTRGQHRSGATSHGTRPGRHVRRGSYTGWGGLASVVEAAKEHPVVDVAVHCPALLRGAR
ncbi:hypothetical protein [Streptosporangium sp. NPDC002721]|uniref:hypothetical protein n=1 Tax=Streptosporangium sp. NPDC002721 TaxID=3366188 RepID=UPI0036776304